MKAAVYTIMGDSAHLVRQWWESAQHADYQVVGVDVRTEAGKRTAAALEAVGAQVVPLVVEPFRFDVARNRVLDAIPHDADFCFHLDDDERVLPAADWVTVLKSRWLPGVTRLRYWYTWDHLPDGRPLHAFWKEKCHARHGFRWKYPVREVVASEPGTVDKFEDVREVEVHHFQEQARPRGFYLPLCELSAKENPNDPHATYYLGQELAGAKRWDNAINVLERYIAIPTHNTGERGHALLYIGECHGNAGRPGFAERAYHRCIAEVPGNRMAWWALAVLYGQNGLHALALSHALRAATLTDEGAFQTAGHLDTALPWEFATKAATALGWKEAADAARAEVEKRTPAVEAKKEVQHGTRGDTDRPPKRTRTRRVPARQ